MEERLRNDPSEDDGRSLESTSNGADDVLDASTRSKSSQSSFASSGWNRTDDLAENRYFGRSENRYVRNLKLLVFLLLFLVTLTICLVIYLYTDGSQQDEFEAAFLSSASGVVESFASIMVDKIAAVAALGVTITASAVVSNSTWPFVIVDLFQQRAASSRSLSGSYYLQVIPIITDDTRLAWEEYSVANKGWMTEARAFQAKKGLNNIGIPISDTADPYITSFIHRTDPLGALISDQGPGPYFPIWQSSPVFPPPLDLVNYNLASVPNYAEFINASASTGQIALGGLDTAAPGGLSDTDSVTWFYAHIFSFAAGKPVNYTGEPISTVYVPVVDSFEDDRRTVAVIGAVIRWESYFTGVLTDSAQPLDVVLSNTCDGPFTYKVQGNHATFLGKGNLANPKYENMAMSVDLDETKFIIEPDTIALTLNQDLCRYTLRVYPTSVGDEYHNDFFPLISTLTVAAVFILTTLVFCCYDLMVERRQKVILDTAQRSTAIVSSIFPKNVRDKLLQAPIQSNATKLRFLADARKRDQGAIQDSAADSLFGASSGPIADLFPHCTVMLADLEGFTAWSSVREPSQVFTLLETIYAAIDRVAIKREVFKVETVGDCYVAVSGLPEPRQDHAVTMARFARDSIAEHMAAVKHLESSLGPETGDLRLRVGLHSGPITAGVLRGERSRFQLFGDTINTAARLETSGEGNRIHVSTYTADLIKKAGHPNWIQRREGSVHLKGKGSMETYWLFPSSKHRPKKSQEESALEAGCAHGNLPTRIDFADPHKKERLIAWNSEALLRVIKLIVARRNTTCTQEPAIWKTTRANPLSEVVEVIELPDKVAYSLHQDQQSIEIDPKVAGLVYKYVSFLADMYPDNPFHNFEHASHVTMSVIKLLSRIVAPFDMDFDDDVQASAKLHDHTYGITSDPLTQFACVFSALIHDVGHPGVSNATLAAEDNKLMKVYGGKSLAEQNSVDQAWDLLMTEPFQPLVSILCQDQSELFRFRQLVVNSVMATDILDPDLKKLRNARWDTAFNNAKVDNKESSRDAINRKATIVIEHIIQASDVSHTMQHWNVYTKWNGRFFKEMYKAYMEGRAGAKNPAEFWAQGEIGFFDFYIIPLAEKLKECGVFGVSSDEYLQYAISNRNEWEEKGERVLEQLLAEVHEEMSRESSRQG